MAWEKFDEQVCPCGCEVICQVWIDKAARQTELRFVPPEEKPVENPPGGGQEPADFPFN